VDETLFDFSESWCLHALGHMSPHSRPRGWGPEWLARRVASSGNA